MGNNPSTLTDKKTGKDRKMISRPMAMGSQRRSLGPDVVISNTILPEPNHRRHSRQNSRQSSLAHSRHASDETSPSPRQSDEVFRPTLRPGASEIRRARSANAPGPVRADRSEGLGAPPPYMTVYEPPTQPGFRLPVSPQSYASPPEDSHIANATNLRRAVTTSTTPGFALPNRAMSPAFDSFSDEMYSGYDRKLLGSEDHGYGVGDGSNTSPIRSRSHSPSDRPLPPVPGSLRFPEPQMDFVPSPVESHTFHNDVEDPLELLKRYNTIFLIDDSLSMRGEKWAEAREALARLADLAAGYDLDGIDAQFLNNNKTVKNMRSASAVKMEFDRTQPQGISLLGMKLEELLRDYISILESDTSVARLSIKPVNYIIITDGGSTDDPEDAIVQAARRLDRGNFPVTQVGIQFVQIGNDPQAAADLRNLDDALPRQYGIRDMVDFTPYSGSPLTSELLVKILLGGISRRVDKKGAGSVMA